jgi:thiol-disulfide isomerase/thioredoxin
MDLKGSRHALQEFGLPAGLARLAGPSLPAAELAVAAALLVRPSARWGAAGALLLLLVFIGGIAHAISQGRAPDCHCFGQIHSEPAGRPTLIRNALLATAALFVLAAGSGPTLDGALGSLNGTQVGLVATSILAAALALGAGQLWGDKRRLEGELARSIAAKAPAGLPRGTRAPDFALTAVRGTGGSLGELMELARPAVFVFVSTSCGPCLQMLATLARWQRSLAGTLTLAAIFSGEAAEVERLSLENDLSTVLGQATDETFIAYALRATPSAVLIDADGVIAGAPAEGVPAIEALIRAAVAQSEPRGIVVHAG